MAWSLISPPDTSCTSASTPSAESEDSQVMSSVATSGPAPALESGPNFAWMSSYSLGTYRTMTFGCAFSNAAIAGLIGVAVP